MSDLPCVCGGPPNRDCERCQLRERIAELEGALADMLAHWEGLPDENVPLVVRRARTALARKES